MDRKNLHDYIKASILPATPEQWRLALNDPKSPYYKLWMDNLHLQQEERLICIELTHLWQQLALQEDHKQREERIKDQISAAAMLEQHMQEIKIPPPSLPPIVSVTELTQQMAEVAGSILSLSSSIEQCDENLADYNLAWQEQVKLHHGKLHDYLLANDIAVFDGQGIRLNSAELDQVFANMPIQASPVQLLKVNPHLANRFLKQEPEHAAQLLTNQTSVVGLLNLQQAINVAKNDREVTGADLLKTLLNNKACCKCYANTYQQQAQETKKLCTDILTTLKEKKLAEKALLKAKEKAQVLSEKQVEITSSFKPKHQ